MKVLLLLAVQLAAVYAQTPEAVPVAVPVAVPEEESCGLSKFGDTMCFDEIDNTWWGFVIEVVVLAICFLGLAIVCDEYLVASLETMCHRLGIREDIAGCTFLAFGSSAPEIIVNSLATMKKTKGSTDLGIGAIIGSGMIAFMLIPGLLGIAGGADSPLILKRRPIARDQIGYLAGLTQLNIYFSDGKITTFESTMLVMSYCVYICVVFFSPIIRKKCCLPPDYVSSTDKKKLEEGSSLITNKKGSVSLGKPKPLIFLDRSGVTVTVPVIGPIFVKEGVEIGTDTSSLHIKLGNPVTLLVEGETAERIYLDNQGAARIITDLLDAMAKREVLVTKEWEVGSRIEAFDKKKRVFVEGTITGKFLENNTYSVRPLNPMKDEMTDVSFADVRPTKDLLPGFTAKAQDASTTLKTRKKMLLHAYEHGALTEQQYDDAMKQLMDRIEIDGVGDDDATSIAPSSVSEFKRQWWKELEEDSENWSKPKRFLMALVAVWKFIFRWTVPYKEVEDEEAEEEDEGNEELTYNSRYPFTLVISLLWVALLSFVIGTVAERWADLSGLGTSFVGLLLISIGAQVPDCISSLAVAKRGLGSMACANSLGSQNINVYIGLGLPWLVSNLAAHEGEFESDIEVEDPTSLHAAAFFQYGGVATNFCLLLGAALATQSNKATLNAKKGYVLVTAYFVVITGYAVYTFTS
eukprot:TRINITY_DN702_c0_g2_i2.p1 TRINITY_DN702_c0_g2~~TRINITY_DN702_c0_g2_i2.p1  ORF type:complete len:708 (+),score=271.10 TRINITY_DN702_c0_g2_i2:49-2124(+)